MPTITPGAVAGDRPRSRESGMATFELLWADDVPDAVVIDEAVGLAKTLSTDDSPAYVNGVLGAILAAEVPSQA